MARKFHVSALSDIGKEVFHDNVRNALHIRQSGLKSSKVRTIQTETNVYLSGFDIEFAADLTRERCADWVLECLRGQYRLQAPLVMMVDELDDGMPIEYAPPGTERLNSV